MDTVIFEAPIDAFISTIASEGPVQAGQLLVSLRSPQLDQERSSLLALEEHLTYLQRPFQDGRIDDEIAALSQKESYCAAAVVEQTLVRDDMQVAVNIGKAVRSELAAENVKLIQAQNSQIDAHLASSHAQRKKTDLLDKLESAKNKIKRDKDFTDAMLASLQISSSVAGKFFPNSFAGSFVRKGHNLGRIEI